jgi:hypothetical protein
VVHYATDGWLLHKGSDDAKRQVGPGTLAWKRWAGRGWAVEDSGQAASCSPERSERRRRRRRSRGGDTCQGGRRIWGEDLAAADEE